MTTINIHLTFLTFDSLEDARNSLDSVLICDIWGLVLCAPSSTDVPLLLLNQKSSRVAILNCMIATKTTQQLNGKFCREFKMLVRRSYISCRIFINIVSSDCRGL